MNVAFYAPLKPPTSPVPSGDRRIARLLIRALKLAGHDVELASKFKSREPDGDACCQAQLAATGDRLAKRLIRRYWSAPKSRRPDVWFTYHLYYKAPDWIGPLVARELEIPYVAAEASFAPKRAGGPWNAGHDATRDAISGARLIFGINSVNAPCVKPLLGTGARYVPMRPFLEDQPRTPVAKETARRDLRLDQDCIWLLAVAMMRDGAKLQSYSLLAEAMALVPNGNWRLLVVGDGPAENQVRELLGGVPAFYAGRKSVAELERCYQAADIFVWPAINEAYGMATLEAARAGLPAVAGNTGGVGDIVCHGETGFLTKPGDAVNFAWALQKLLDDPGLRAKMGAAAAARVKSEHSLAAASQLLDTELRKVVV